jgi:two-component system, LytTR family, sensor histidine kinase AlgZ
LDSSEPGVCGPPRGLFPRVSAVVLVAAAAVTLIFVSLQPGSTPARVLGRFIGALIYSACIAYPSAFAMFYAERLPIPRVRGLKLFRDVLVLLATNLAGCAAAGLLLILLGLAHWDQYGADLKTNAVFGAVITLTFGLSMHFYSDVRAQLETATLEIRTRQVEEERARKLAAEAQLSSLESRIHPHFLFNTLNSIAALIPNDARRAEELVGKLASLLRFSLGASQAGLVPLAQEIRVVRDYLEIERTRFGARLRYTIEVPPEVEEAGVPALSVQSLVENSIKHVIAQRPEGGEIHVRASRITGCLELEVSDSGPGFAMHEAPPGHGLDNLAGRLNLLFGPEARLEAARDGERASVRIALPLRQERAALV